MAKKKRKRKVKTALKKPTSTTRKKIKRAVKIPAGWVVKETDKDLKGLDNLYDQSCERCGRKGAGSAIKKMCAECIVSSNNCHFKLKKGLE